METSAMLSPLRFGDYLRKHSLPAEPSEPWMPPTPEPNFIIDDLLDFSNGELCDESDEEMREELKEANLNVGYGAIEVKVDRRVAEEESQQQQATTSGLCLPSDELADQLEWLSAFNEDSSFSGDRHLASLVSSGCLGGSKDDEKPAASLHDDTFQSPSPNSVLEPSSVFHVGAYSHLPSTNCCNSTQHGLSRARSKRARAGARIWSLDSLMPTLFDTRHTGAGAQESPVFFGSRVSHVSVAPAKKAKKPAFLFKPMLEAPARRCSHCLVTKTPQWRAGPMGPKTLCNACGVRYKSGRLVPEYRPAGSPTFVSEVHSNSHKRILEMRRMKEREDEHVPLPKDEEEEESDCFSQNEFCKGYEREDLSTLNCSSQEDLNGITCSEKDDAMGSFCNEKDDATGSVCCEKDDATGSTCNERDESTG